MDENERKAVLKGILLSILMITATLAFLTSSPAAAENSEPIIIIRGGPSAYNKSRLDTPPPYRKYVAGDYPPVMIVAKYGTGGVAAAGIAATLKNGRWNGLANPGPHLDVLLDKTFQWMAPGAENVLWYEGYGVYADQKVTGTASELGDALRAVGYAVIADSTQPISEIDLSTYDIVVIPGVQLGNPNSGGDPSLFPDDDVTALVNFVSAGGGLLVINNADYAGYNFCEVSNKILENFYFPYLFQCDTLADLTTWASDSYTYEIDTTTEIGGLYQASTGDNVIGFYKPHSLAQPTPYRVAVSIVETTPTLSPQVTPDYRPTMATARPGEDIQIVIGVLNFGLVEDNYTISAVDDLGWQIEVSPTTLKEVPAGGGSDVTVEITVDPALEDKVQNLVAITVTGTGVGETVTISTAPYFPSAQPPYDLLSDNHSLIRKNPIFYQFSSTSLLVEPPARPIIIGTETANTLDETYREPYPVPIGRGEFPVVAAAAEVGNGRVIVYGPGPSFRTVPTTHFGFEPLRMKELCFDMMGWLARWENAAQQKVLFYWTPLDAFHSADQCSEWISYLREIGYTVHTYTDGITAARLAPYNVFMFIGPERAFTNDEISAIEDWVRAGGGLFLSDQADYAEYCRAVYSNPILEALGVNIRIQDDQATDNEKYNRWPWDLRVYLVDHPVWYPPYAVSADAGPGALTVNAGGKATFTLTIYNDGTEAADYEIEVISEKDWPVVLEREEVTLAGGQIENIQIVADTPPAENLKRENVIRDSNDYTVQVTGSRASTETSFRLITEIGEEPSEKPWGVIAAAIVIIVIITGTAFFALKRRRSSRLETTSFSHATSPL